MWRRFVELTVDRGHRVIMVTGRRKWSDDMQRSGIPSHVRIIYSGDQLKQRAAAAAGFAVDVWIDDMPGTIQPCVLLENTHL